MKLPNASNARAEKEKIIDYLLNARHPYGSSKAGFFTRFGFTVEQWESFAERLRQQGSSHPVSRVTETVFGPRYNVRRRNCHPISDPSLNARLKRLCPSA
jgi:hypothetical protein